MCFIERIGYNKEGEEMTREKKFTPGPWEFDLAVSLDPDDERETCAIYYRPEPNHIVEVVETPDIYGGECIHGNNIANAHLIAAAPELLKALELMGQIADNLGWAEATTGRQIALNDAKKAIAKAYGE
jgi:hypothetical protein